MCILTGVKSMHSFIHNPIDSNLTELSVRNMVNGLRVRQSRVGPLKFIKLPDLCESTSVKGCTRYYTCYCCGKVGCLIRKEVVRS